MGTKRMSLGKWGEDKALEYLENQGFSLRERNWRSGHREIDLIMETPEKLHIVEVKTLRKPSPIEPWEHVTAAKRTDLATAANRYISINHVHKEVQFDIVSILVEESGDYDLRFIPDAFFPILFTR